MSDDTTQPTFTTTITATNLTEALIDAVRIFAEFAGNTDLIRQCENAGAAPHPTFGVHPVTTRARVIVVAAIQVLIHAAGTVEAIQVV